MKKDYLGAQIPKLGFGLMRLPKKGDAIDPVEVSKMVDLFMEKGFTYFDTAYVYGNGESEMIAGKCLVDRYPRESFQLTSKMPFRDYMTEEDLPKIFNTSLERTHAGYFDFYLLHALNANNYEICKKLGGWEFAAKMKEQGFIKHLGFSFHDKAEVLDRILTEHPEAEFVQLQINYADWEDAKVQSRLCYEVCMKHEKPVIIMEPVKGGNLAFLPEELQERLRKMDPDLSIPSWAVRFAASLDGLVTVLSGMSNLQQMEDNVSYMENFKRLTDEEKAEILDIARVLSETPKVPCTACRYCTDGCPMKIDIPAYFSAYNEYLVFRNIDKLKAAAKGLAEKGGSCADCIECGQCERVCPQQIGIIEKLKEIAEIIK